MESGIKRTQRDYTLAFKLAVVEQVDVTSRTIIWPLVKKMRMRLMPLFHGLHRRTALER